jgi:hypothetical protein
MRNSHSDTDAHGHADGDSNCNSAAHGDTNTDSEPKRDADPSAESRTDRDTSRHAAASTLGCGLQSICRHSRISRVPADAYAVPRDGP